VAAATGRTIHPEVVWDRIVVSKSGHEELRDIHPPGRGSLDPEERAALVPLLRTATATPGVCWFLQWTGFGDILDDLRRLPRVQLPAREYLLFRGPLEAAKEEFASHGEPPNLWWPDDRAWCVATEIDLMSTYVAGTPELIDTLLTSEFEVLRTTADARVDNSADEINSD
jgi:hypothetical protein